MRAINVWAWQARMTESGPFQRAPICSDGSQSVRRWGIRGGVSQVSDANWHFALSYTSLADLATQLRETELPDYIQGEHRTLQRGEVQTLAIDCHGSDGLFYPEGVPGPTVTARNLGHYSQALTDIGLMTASREHRVSLRDPSGRARSETTVGPSTIIIMSCNTAAGQRGTELLVALSYRWPNRSVVSFATTVAFPNLRLTTQPGSQDQCQPPLGVDTGVHGMRSEQAAEWYEEFSSNTPRQMPYAQATSENAKVAVNGRIEQFPISERRSASLSPAITGPPRGTVARPTVSSQGRRSVV